MGAYHILGKSVQSHHLALATLGSVVFVVAPKPWAPSAPKHPEINASSKDEEKFVQEWLAKHSAEETH